MLTAMISVHGYKPHKSTFDITTKYAYYISGKVEIKVKTVYASLGCRIKQSPEVGAFILHPITDSL